MDHLPFSREARQERIATLERYTGRSMRLKVLRIDSLVVPDSPSLADLVAPHRYGAFLICRKQDPPWSPDAPPISRADTFETLKEQLLVPPWEQVYELDVDALPPDVPNIRRWMPAKGAQIVVRVRDPGPHVLRSMDTHYQYFQVQLSRLPANPVRDTVILPASPKASAHTHQGRPRRLEKTQELKNYLERMKTYVQKQCNEGKTPQAKDLYIHIGGKDSTVYRWCKAAVALEGYSTTKEWLKNFMHVYKGRHC